MLWAGDDAQNIFHKLAVSCDKRAYRCHTGCFGLTVVRYMNGIELGTCRHTRIWESITVDSNVD